MYLTFAEGFKLHFLYQGKPGRIVSTQRLEVGEV